jgi:hypothetical protein
MASQFDAKYWEIDQASMAALRESFFGNMAQGQSAQFSWHGHILAMVQG